MSGTVLPFRADFCRWCGNRSPWTTFGVCSACRHHWPNVPESFACSRCRRTLPVSDPLAWTTTYGGSYPYRTPCPACAAGRRPGPGDCW